MSKLSVIISVYNAENTIEKTIKSILNQTFNDFEVICINNGSTDNSWDILNSFAQIDNRIKVYNFEKKSTGAVFNEIVNETSPDSKYLCFVTQDDELYDSYLEKLYSYINDKNINMAVFSENSAFETAPLCARIINKQFFTGNNIKFSEENYDLFFVPVDIEIMSLTRNVHFIKENLYSVNNIKTKNIDLEKYYTVTCVLSWLNAFKNEKELKKVEKKIYIILKNFIKEVQNKIMLKSLIPAVYLNYRNLKRFILLNYIKYKLYRIKLEEKAERRKNKGRWKKRLDTIDILNVGKYTYCAAQPIISDCINTTIGSFCSFASDIKIGIGNHPINYISTSPYLYLDNLAFKVIEDVNYNSIKSVLYPPPFILAMMCGLAQVR